MLAACEGGETCLWASCLLCLAGTASESWRGSRGNLTEQARRLGWLGDVWEAKRPPEKGHCETTSSGGWRGASQVHRSCCSSLLFLPTNDYGLLFHGCALIQQVPCLTCQCNLYHIRLIILLPTYPVQMFSIPKKNALKPREDLCPEFLLLSLWLPGWQPFSN